MKNHAEIIKLGDVTKVYFKNDFLIHEFKYDDSSELFNRSLYVGKIDLLIGGSLVMIYPNNIK